MATQATTNATVQTAPKTTLYAQADLENNNIVWCLDDKNPPKKCKIKLDFPKNAGAQSISVNLIDNTGKGLEFSSDPLWVSENGCPPPNGSKSAQIQDVVAAGLLLTFTDLNQGDACTLFYQMNFVDDNNNTVIFDPEIKNGGTNLDKGLSGPIIAVAAVAVIAIAAFLWLR